MHRPSIVVFLTFALGALSMACSGDPGNTTSSSSSSSGAGGGSSGSSSSSSSGAGGGMGCAPATVPCSDQAILQLNFLKNITTGQIGNSADGSGWLSTVDATAGGLNVNQSYTYGKFTDQGLTKVMISDEQSLDSQDWDIAFRRYVIRINSGNSGPSCVKAAQIATGAANYDKISAVPANAMYGVDSYFGQDPNDPMNMCFLLDDKSGLPGSPATRVHDFWQYTSCVQMTDAIFAIELADGRHVKLTVVDYYTPAVQDQCDTTGMIPMMNTGSGNYRVRWAILP